jgi:Ca2+-dependent lipid-binding protein
VRVSKRWQVVKCLYVKVMKGREFPAMDANGQSDPYVICGVGDFQARTRTIWKNRHDPDWDEEFTFQFE